MAKIVFFTGGARSGKSRLAEQRFSADQRVVYIATAQAGDAEMARRIEQHQLQRPQSWTTLSETLDLTGAIVQALNHKPDGILIDCLTLWASNHILREWAGGWQREHEEAVQTQLEQALKELRRAPVLQAVLVSNEVGCGIVPDNPLARSFRDLLGRINQRTAAVADEAYLCAAGLPLKLK